MLNSRNLHDSCTARKILILTFLAMSVQEIIKVNLTIRTKAFSYIIVKIFIIKNRW